MLGGSRRDVQRVGTIVSNLYSYAFENINEGQGQLNISEKRACIRLSAGWYGMRRPYITAGHHWRIQGLSAGGAYRSLL